LPHFEIWAEVNDIDVETGKYQRVSGTFGEELGTIFEEGFPRVVAGMQELWLVLSDDEAARLGWGMSFSSDEIMFAGVMNVLSTLTSRLMMRGSVGIAAFQIVIWSSAGSLGKHVKSPGIE
jgi:hypothetical protein